jgi:hypothetical protein
MMVLPADGIGLVTHMIDQAFGRMRPLYEAMSVCSSALEWLEREEQKHED